MVMNMISKKKHTMENNAKKNAIWFTLGSGIFAATSALTILLMTREFGLNIAGQFSIAQTTAQLLYLVSIFGISVYQMTDFKCIYTFEQYFSARLLTSSIALIIGLFLIFVLGFEGLKAWFTILLICFILCNAIADVFQSFFFQINRLDIAGKSLFWRMLISNIIFACGLMLGNDAIIATILMVLTNVVTTVIFSVLPIKHYQKCPIKIVKKDVLILLKECYPLFLCTFLLFFIINCPKYAIEVFMDDKEQAYIGIILMPATLINLLSSFIFKPLLNRFDETIRNKNINCFKKMLKKLVYIITCITFLTGVGVYFFGPWIFGLVYNVNLNEFRSLLVLVIIGSGFQSYTSLLYFLLVLLREQRKIMKIYIFVTMIILIISFAGVYLLGLTGAVFAFVIGYFILAVLSLALKNRALRRCGIVRTNCCYHNL